MDTYRFVNPVPVRDGEGALDVNWCELTTSRDDGKVVYKNAFATNHRISAANVADMVGDGRARWKVENENNNTLKTKGYHLTHNFGHGKQHLSSLLATLASPGPRSRIDRPAVDPKKWAPNGRPITRRSREEKTWQLAFSDLN
jgi:hypothetical protein